jgi:hypothetical protein
VKVSFNIGPSAGPRRGRLLLLAASTPAKKVADQIRDVAAVEACPARTAAGRTTKARATKAGATRLRHWPNTARLVVLGPLVGITDYFISGRYFFEPVFCSRVTGVGIWVQFASEFAISRGDLFCRCLGSHAKERVVVLLKPLSLHATHLTFLLFGLSTQDFDHGWP